MLYLLTQIHFLIGEEYATCHGSKRTNSPGNNNLNFRLAQVVHLETSSISRKQTSLFPLEPVIKYLMKTMFISGLKMTLWIRLPSMETWRTQDMPLTINNCISDKASSAVRDLITLRSSKYHLWHDYILSLPKINTTNLNMVSNHGDILPPKNGTSYQMMLGLK